jgi:hypothetical protein
LQRSRNQFPNPAAVKGLPYSVTKNVKSPVGLALMTSARTGRIGFSDAVMRLYRILRGMYFRTPISLLPLCEGATLIDRFLPLATWFVF